MIVVAFTGSGVSNKHGSLTLLEFLNC